MTEEAQEYKIEPTAKTADELAVEDRVKRQHGVFVTFENIINLANINSNETVQVAMHLMVKSVMDSHDTEPEALKYLDEYFNQVLDKLRFDLAARAFMPAGTVN